MGHRLSLEELGCKKADDRTRVSKGGFCGAGTDRAKETKNESPMKPS